MSERSELDLVECFAQQAVMQPIKDRIERPVDRADRLRALRQFYQAVKEDILSEPAHVWGIDPYECDWDRLFTPIEGALWHDIRYQCAVLYPQYPVGKYFVDFGNPKAMVAIECDGARWHTDTERDLVRQREIERMGWSVYRISGRDCLTTSTESEDEETGRLRLHLGAAEIFIRDIAQMHGLSARYV